MQGAALAEVTLTSRARRANIPTQMQTNHLTVPYGDRLGRLFGFVYFGA